MLSSAVPILVSYRCHRRGRGAGTELAFEELATVCLARSNLEGNDVTLQTSWLAVEMVAGGNCKRKYLCFIEKLDRDSNCRSHGCGGKARADCEVVTWGALVLCCSNSLVAKIDWLLVPPEAPTLSFPQARMVVVGPEESCSGSPTIPCTVLDLLRSLYFQFDCPTCSSIATPTKPASHQLEWLER